MASVGPLLLLLMSYILISTVTISTPANRRERVNEALKNLKNKLTTVAKAAVTKTVDIKKVVNDSLTLIKDVGNVMTDLKDDILQVAQSMINVVPVVGSALSLIMTLVIVIEKHVNDRSLLKDIKEEFDKLDDKLDQYHMEQKWNIWAAGVYHKPELDIRLAWTEYKTLLEILAEVKEEEEEKHRQNFIDAYSKYENAPREMGELLKKTGRSFINNLGDELAEHVKCHEKEILEYTFLILTLIIKGNMMNEYYYRLRKIESNARHDEMTKNVYEAMAAMFDIQKGCIVNSMTYVLRDVKPLIDKDEKRDDLAKDIQSFLQDEYDRYDWMVVAFITKNSTYKFWKKWSRHMLTGFHSVSTQRVTVAVARQVKGHHTKAQKVSNAIKSCFINKVECYKVAEKLSTCTEMVAGIPVNKTYTAVHAYTRKAHQSPVAQTPYIHTGKCDKGKFAVLIKSDEEMTETDLCSKMDCGEELGKGTCVPMENMFRALCQCNYPYYGERCENNINDYREELKKEEKTYKRIITVSAERYKKIIIVRAPRPQNRK